MYKTDVTFNFLMVKIRGKGAYENLCIADIIGCADEYI
jgi:hypothetical protein